MYQENHAEAAQCGAADGNKRARLSLGSSSAAGEEDSGRDVYVRTQTRRLEKERDSGTYKIKRQVVYRTFCAWELGLNR